jgi:hypothetical protein
VNKEQIIIGQKRIAVDKFKTSQLYSTYPKISENCSCSDCAYFEKEVIYQDFPLFHLLHALGVDLSRQPNIVPDGICCPGEINDRIIYYGYYKVVGSMEDNQETIECYNNELGPYTSLTIQRANDQELIFEFYIEAENKEE